MSNESRYSRASTVQSTGGTAPSYKGDALKKSRRAKKTKDILSGVGIALGALATVATAGAASPLVAALAATGSSAADLGVSGAAAKKGSIDEYLASPPVPPNQSKVS